MKQAINEMRIQYAQRPRNKEKIARLKAQLARLEQEHDAALRFAGEHRLSACCFPSFATLSLSTALAPVLLTLVA